MTSRGNPRSTQSSLVPYRLTRVGIIMSADASDPLEAEGVLNPATAWGSDGDLYLYPRMVAEGNFSRIGKARVILVDGVPTSVERQGVVLEPDRPWEHGVRHGGVEDPRITWVPSLDAHVMTYVAFGPFGPRPAVAISRDQSAWRRLGPVQFRYEDVLETDLNLYPNKDVVFFPEVVPDPEGRPSYAVLHRPSVGSSSSPTQTRSRRFQQGRPTRGRASGSHTFPPTTSKPISPRSPDPAGTGSSPDPNSTDKRLCKVHKSKADNYRKSKTTVDFDFIGGKEHLKEPT